MPNFSSLAGLEVALKSTIPAGGRVVGSGGRVGSGRVGWLDNWEIMLNSVQLSWKLTELGNK